MKKIEPVMYQVGSVGECVSPNHITVGDIMRGAMPLYTREAFESALESMKQECMFAAKEWAMMHVEVDHAPHGVDAEISKYVSVCKVLESILGE